MHWGEPSSPYLFPTVEKMMSKILMIVDDEQSVRKGLKGYFSVRGFEIHEAGDGMEALDILSEKRVDLIISDILMPRMNGVELLCEVRKQYPMIRVIMITGQVKLEYALTCMRKGADDCIFKPISDMKELDDAVKESYHKLKRWQIKLETLSAMKDENKDANT